MYDTTGRNPALDKIERLKSDRRLLLWGCCLVLLWATGTTFLAQYFYKEAQAYKQLECVIHLKPEAQQQNLIQANYPLPVERPMQTIDVAYETTGQQRRNTIELFEDYAVVDNDLHNVIEGEGYSKILQYAERGLHTQVAWMILYVHTGDGLNLPTNDNLEYLNVTGFIK